MKRTLYLLIIVLIVACRSESYKDVGDIPYDRTKDDPSYELCDENLIKQYYIRHSKDLAPSYAGEKSGLERVIYDSYSHPQDHNQNGYITIRFIVNCKGKPGRFRIEEMDVDFQPYAFPKSISTQVLNIVRSLDQWTPRKRKEKAYDFYQYLTFKIESGQITKILP